jgi:chromosome partitioning protein
MSLHVVAIINQKGGVGKSTATTNLGDELGALGLRVLVIDADPQGTTTEAMLAGVMPPHGLAEVLGFDGITARDAKVKAPNHRCDLLAARYAALRTRISELRTSPLDSQSAMLKLLVPIENDYDIVLVDCSPDLDVLTSAALVAATEVLVPTQPAREAAHGLGYLFGRIESARQFNKDLGRVGLAITMFNARLGFDQEFHQLLSADKRFDYHYTIRHTSGFKRGFDLGKPLSGIVRSDTERAAVGDLKAIAEEIAKSAGPKARAKAARGAA